LETEYPLIHQEADYTRKVLEFEEYPFP